MTEDRVGPFDAHFGAEELWDPEFGAEWFYRTEPYSIAGPDNEMVVAGLYVNSANGIVEVRFQVRLGQLQIGAQIDGYPEEYIEVLNPAGLVLNNSTWTGVEEGRFYWDTTAYDTDTIR